MNEAHSTQGQGRRCGVALTAVGGALVWLAILGAPGCASFSSLPTTAPAPSEWSGRILLHGHPLQLHFARPRVLAPGHLLVLYASGDGGWFGTAIALFHALADAGYPAVGISSRALLELHRHPRTLLTPAQLADDYAAILAQARKTFGLAPDTRTILTGWSRGASLAVLAASTDHPEQAAAGVIALGLPDGEDLLAGSGDAATDDGGAEPRHAWPFAPYATARTLHGMPVVVLQAGGDAYVPAATARVLFGPDGPAHRLRELPGRNHRFGGAEADLVAAIHDAFTWIATWPH